MVKTTFRETLIRELGELARSREIDDRFVRIVYVEEKIDVLGGVIRSQARKSATHR
jgi:hypothetical protein